MFVMIAMLAAEQVDGDVAERHRLVQHPVKREDAAAEDEHDRRKERNCGSSDACGSDERPSDHRLRRCKARSRMPR